MYIAYLQCAKIIRQASLSDMYTPSSQSSGRVKKLNVTGDYSESILHFQRNIKSE